MTLALLIARVFPERSSRREPVGDFTIKRSSRARSLNFSSIAIQRVGSTVFPTGSLRFRVARSNNVRFHESIETRTKLDLRVPSCSRERKSKVSTRTDGFTLHLFPAIHLVKVYAGRYPLRGSIHRFVVLVSGRSMHRDARYCATRRKTSRLAAYVERTASTQKSVRRPETI